LQIVQYFSQLQFDSVRSHWPQTMGPAMEASWKTVPDEGRTQQAGRSGYAAFRLLHSGFLDGFVALCHLPLIPGLAFSFFDAFGDAC
jgi:hypothetical protein